MNLSAVNRDYSNRTKVTIAGAIAGGGATLGVALLIFKLAGATELPWKKALPLATVISATSVLGAKLWLNSLLSELDQGSSKPVAVQSMEKRSTPI